MQLVDYGISTQAILGFVAHPSTLTPESISLEHEKRPR